MNEVIVVIGAGSIGQGIARRVSAGKQVVLADLHRENADAAAEVMRNAGFDVNIATVDVSSRESVHALVETATALGDVTGVIHAAGVSPSQASPATILAVDLYGTALVLEEFGSVIAHGGAGVVIARTVPRRARRHPRRSRNRRRASHGPRRRVHHRQRLPHRRRSYRLLLLRRTCAAVTPPPGVKQSKPGASGRRPGQRVEGTLSRRGSTPSRVFRVPARRVPAATRAPRPPPPPRRLPCRRRR
jgi:NAD(P)-dependent dehydrogenase (short-subunit alcohol dehydrogenase family)